MAYSNFTLESVRSVFKLETVQTIDLFSEIEPVTPSSQFTEELRKKVPLAVAIGTEKARSELIVDGMSCLSSGNTLIAASVSFLGIDFSVDAEKRLSQAYATF